MYLLYKICRKHFNAIGPLSEAYVIEKRLQKYTVLSNICIYIPLQVGA
jgi:hypothetical protein